MTDKKGFIYPSRIKTSNLGDILINVLLIRELSKLGNVYLDGAFDKSIQELILTNNPFASNIITVTGIKSFEGKPVVRWINLFKTIKNVSFVLDPPGAYIEGYSPLKAKLKYHKYKMRAIILKSLFNIKMLRLGVSLGPFSDNFYHLQKKLSEVYYSIAVRDSLNFADLKGRNFSNISLIDDLAFLYNKIDFKFLTDNKLDKSKNTQPLIVISLRGDIEGHKLNIEYFNSLAERVISILKVNPNYQLKLAYQVQEDLEVLEALKVKLDEHNIAAELLKEQLTLGQAIHLYASANYVITNRLHVALFAILNDTIPLITTDIKKHKKIVNIFKDLDLEEILIDFNSKETFTIDETKDDEYLQVFNQAKKLKQETIINHLKSR